jgi:hypothetical protein
MDPDVQRTRAAHLYAGDDPTANTDPSGLDWEPIPFTTRQAYDQATILPNVQVYPVGLGRGPGLPIPAWPNLATTFFERHYTQDCRTTSIVCRISSEILPSTATLGAISSRGQCALYFVTILVYLPTGATRVNYYPPPKSK